MGEYDPASIEKKWQNYWETNKTFKAGAPGKKKFYCLDMFPYPSGAGLHIGHPLGYTASDIYSRYKRMQGYSVLHPMGYDAFGLPAEQHAVNTGEHPAVITNKSCETFTRQLKTIGFSYDWDRELATCSEDYYRWTQWIFLKLYNSWFDKKAQRARPIEELSIPGDVSAQGAAAVSKYREEYRLAFYADATVNWCPALGTVLANEEVIEGKSERGGHEVVRKPMKQWLLRITQYADRLLSELESLEWPESIKEQQRNWIGKRFGTEINFQIEGRNEKLVAFTTRPDTLFGVTFFVLSPEHPLVPTLPTADYKVAVAQYCEKALHMSEFTRTLEKREKTGVFSGSYVLNPINGESVPIFVGDYVLMSVGTGAVMGVPAHDERDFEFARAYQIPIRPVIAPQTEDAELRGEVIEGEISWTEPGIMLPCDSNVARELKLEGTPNKEAARRINDWLTKHGHGREVVTYKLRDWLFSRQRYWGEPIPIIHWEDGTSTALDESELPLLLPKVEDYKPSESGESPLAKAADWVQVCDAKTGKRGRRETNTMPQWAGSCWYYLRFIDPKNGIAGWDPHLERGWMPIDLYIGGAEHAVLHLLYARFWHKVLYDLGFVSTKEPFQKLFNQGMIQAYAYKNRRGALIPVDEVDEQDDGTATHLKTGESVEKLVAKMSKSLKNVINPDDVLKEFGADTLRTYLMFMGPLDTSRVWEAKAIVGSFRFLKKSWNFVTQNADSGFRQTVAEKAQSPAVVKAVNRAIKRVGEDIESMHYNTGISTLMEFLNAVSHEQVSKPTLEKFVLLLAPFAPHIGEELWQRLGHTKTITYEPWPSYSEAALQEDTVSVVVQVAGKKRAVIEVSADITQDELKKKIIERLERTEYKASESDRFITIFQQGTSVPKLVNVLKG